MTQIFDRQHILPLGPVNSQRPRIRFRFSFWAHSGSFLVHSK